MKLNLLLLVPLICALGLSRVRAASSTCLDQFRSFQPIEIQSSKTNESSGRVTAWYTNSRCMVVGSPSGLWLYDIDQPNNSLRLTSQAVVTNVAVNPIDATIAFSVSQIPLVYLIHPDGTTSTLSVSGQAITAIAFSPDGSLIAAASAEIVSGQVELNGLYYDSRVQIWNSANQYRTELSLHEDRLTPYKITKGLFFSSDNQYLLTDSVRAGYDQDVVDYWDISASAHIWSDDDLFYNLQKDYSDNDPLVPGMALLHNQIVALGGLDGWHSYDDYYGSGIHIWDAKTRQRKVQIVVFERGTGEEAKLTDMAFNTEGTEIVSSQTDGTIKFWNVSDGKQIGEFASKLESPVVAFSPDDRFFSVHSQNEILIWDITTNQPYTTLHIAP